MAVKKMTKSYSELMTLRTFEERYDYLKLNGTVGATTFGGYRDINQMLYKSNYDWRITRDKVIVRDNGCDLAVPDRPIIGCGDYEQEGVNMPKIIIHHINPVTIDDIIDNPYSFFDMDNLICTSLITHNGIHYGRKIETIFNPLNIRKPNDTCPWK